MCIDKIYDKFKEECGVFGVFSSEKEDLRSILYSGLQSLQHRGEESCGICIRNQRLERRVAKSYVRDFFESDNYKLDKGLYISNGAIGHTRYSTSGSSNLENAQPLLSKEEDISICHNGNIINHKIIKEYLGESYTFETNSDSEIILALIKKNLNKDKITKKNLKDAIQNAMKELKGSYCVLLISDEYFAAFRDPRGIRPLCIAGFEDKVLISSETTSFNGLDLKFRRDIRPGEIVIGDKNIELESFFTDTNTKKELCAFEMIYFAREDSTIDGMNIYQKRLSLGRNLAKKEYIKQDVVIGVPSSGMIPALGFSLESNIELSLSIIKNNEYFRSFISPNQDDRIKITDKKLRVIEDQIKNKSLLVVDDSIVRGNAMKVLVKRLKKAQAKEIHIRIASPIIFNHCNLGIDIKNNSELLSFNRDIELMKESLGVDSLEFLSIEELKQVIGDEICTRCFCR